MICPAALRFEDRMGSSFRWSDSENQNVSRVSQIKKGPGIAPRPFSFHA
jgi:hypothetical protein